MLYLYIILGVLGFLLLLFIVLFIIVFKAHNKVFNKRFMPHPLIKFYTKEEFNLDYERIEIKYKNDTIVGGLYSYGEYDGNKLVVFSHGMESCKESYMQEIGYLCHNGFLVLAFDYLGTNESTGKIEGFGTSLKSLDIVINYIKSNDQLKNKEIYVMGHSWGGYAALNIVSLHKDIKRVLALAPAVSFYSMLRNMYKRGPIISLMLLLVDRIKLGRYSTKNGYKSLKNYNGRILLVQSKDDNMVSYSSSVGYLKDKLGEKAEYIIMDDRKHNPDYKLESVNYLNEFVSNVFKYNGEEQVEYIKAQDFHKMGELDQTVMDKLVDFLKK